MNYHPYLITWWWGWWTGWGYWACFSFMISGGLIVARITTFGGKIFYNSMSISICISINITIICISTSMNNPTTAAHRSCAALNLSADPAAPTASPSFIHSNLPKNIFTVFSTELLCQLLSCITLIDHYALFFALINIDVNIKNG